MRPRLTHLAATLAGLAAAGGFVAVVLAVKVPLHATLPPSVLASSAAVNTELPLPTMDSAVVARDVFRRDRAPALVPFDPLGNAHIAPVGEPQPGFVLVGLVLGRARAAVIRGIPGLEAAQVLAEGDERAGLRVVRIDQTGVDAVWRGDSLRLALPREGM